jgi:hypothetical protein
MLIIFSESKRKIYSIQNWIENYTQNKDKAKTFSPKFRVIESQAKNFEVIKN